MMTQQDVFKKYDLPFETYFHIELERSAETHEDMELVWLLKGQATIVCDHTTFHLSEQNVFMIYMNRLHSIKTTEDSIVIIYRFKTEQLKRINLNFHTIPFKHRVYTFKELCEKYHEVPLLITQILKLLVSPKVTPITRYKIIGYYNLFLYELYNTLLKEKYLDVKHQNYDPYLIRLDLLIEYISEHLEEKISLQTLSEIVGISKSRLSHFFKESLDISFSEFLQNARFEQALIKLKFTDLSVQEVSDTSGFSDVKYLNKMLKERFQMTALKYRKFIKQHIQSTDKRSRRTNFITALNECIYEIKTNQNFTDTYGLKKNIFDQE
jgi:AraC-like DNA-binding protein